MGNLEQQDNPQHNPLRITRPERGGPAPLGPGCPSLEDWGLYEAGLQADAKAAEMLEHASDCLSCGELLVDLHGEAGSGEGTIVALRSNTLEWKREMLSRIDAELGGEKHREAPVQVRLARKNFSMTMGRWWVAAAAAVTVVVGNVWWLNSANTPFALVGKAYTAQRPFEARLAADYAPYRPIRGGVNLDNAALLKARLGISEKLEQSPEDPDWLRASAELALLQSNIKTAIDVLKRIQITRPDDANVWGDLGIAYLQRADMESRAQDIAVAIEDLTKATAAAPSNAIFQFNLALAYQRQPAPRRAIEEWDKFLRLESSGPWADEARENQKKLKEHIDEEIKKQAGTTQTPASSDDQIFNLFAQGFHSTATLNAPAIAADLEKTYHDPWLRDLLAGGSGSEAALGTLKEAAEAFALGDSDVLEVRSRQAAQAFQRLGNDAGFLFASWQQAYAYQRLLTAPECVKVAEGAIPGAKKKIIFG